MRGHVAARFGFGHSAAEDYVFDVGGGDGWVLFEKAADDHWGELVRGGCCEACRARLCRPGCGAFAREDVLILIAIPRGRQARTPVPHSSVLDHLAYLAKHQESRKRKNLFLPASKRPHW